MIRTNAKKSAHEQVLQEITVPPVEVFQNERGDQVRIYKVSK